MPCRGQVRLVAKRGPLYLWLENRLISKFDKELDLAPIPNNAIHDTAGVLSLPSKIVEALSRNNEILTLAFGTVVGSTLFSRLHYLAWNFYFPTLGKALAWRICLVMTSALPLLSIVLLGFWIRLNL